MHGFNRNLNLSEPKILQKWLIEDLPLTRNSKKSNIYNGVFGLCAANLLSLVMPLV